MSATSMRQRADSAGPSGDSSWAGAGGRPPLVMHVVYRFAVGGLENGVVNLINRLPESEFRHAIVALTDCDPEFCRRIERPVELVSLHKSAGHGFKLFGRVYRLIRDLRPAIVHTRNLAALEMQAPAWAARVPVRVHGEHGRDVTDPDGTNRRHRWARRAYAPFVTQYVAVSAELENYLVDVVGIARQRVLRICNGVDHRKFSPAERQSVGAAPERFVIGAVGRLQTIKGHATLIEAVDRLLRAQPEKRDVVRLRLVGDGPLRADLERDAAARGLADVVEFLGERDDVPRLLRTFDVLALPSLAEGISNTILEGMATGLPVVATAVGGNPELVDDGKTGLLVPAGDAERMAAALAKYLNAPELKLRHGREARAEVERRFSLDGMVERYRSLYHSLLAARRRAAAGLG